MEEDFNMILCKSISYDIEKNNGFSIVEIGERLDFKTLLARSAAGIIDLSSFQLPRTSDLSGEFDASDDKSYYALQEKKEELLNRPSSVMDNCFGASVDQAEAEYRRHVKIARENSKPVEDKKPASSPTPAPPASPAPPAPPAPSALPAAGE